MKRFAIVLILGLSPGAAPVVSPEALEATSKCLADVTGDTLANITAQVGRVAGTL